jgi:hypothetical protein
VLRHKFGKEARTLASAQGGARRFFPPSKGTRFSVVSLLRTVNVG